MRFGCIDLIRPPIQPQKYSNYDEQPAYEQMKKYHIFALFQHSYSLCDIYIFYLGILCHSMVNLQILVYVQRVLKYISLVKCSFLQASIFHFVLSFLYFVSIRLCKNYYHASRAEKLILDLVNKSNQILISFALFSLI